MQIVIHRFGGGGLSAYTSNQLLGRIHAASPQIVLGVTSL